MTLYELQHPYSLFVLSLGDCGLCFKPVEGEESGCVALDQVYHNSCFKCMKCSESVGHSTVQLAYVCYRLILSVESIP